MLYLGYPLAVFAFDPPRTFCKVCCEPLDLADGVAVWAEGRPVGVRHKGCEQ